MGMICFFRLMTLGRNRLYVGSDDAIRNAFSVEPKDNTLFLPGVMSRKKQIIPMLTALWG